MGDEDTERYVRFAFLQDASDVLERMTIAEHRARSADDEVLDLGYRARDLGASWREIADSIGITQQAANARWGTAKSERGRDARRRRIQRLTDLKLGRQARRAAYEHERRFLVHDLDVLSGLRSFRIRQAYLWTDPAGYTVRVRVTEGESDEGYSLKPPATLTFKGPRDPSGSRIELTQELPTRSDAETILRSAHNIIEKERYIFMSDGRPYIDIDVFTGANAGLVVAEFESGATSVAAFTPPEWCGEEITADRRFDNESLARRPYSTWEEVSDQSAS